jgi:hypothetical protein
VNGEGKQLTLDFIHVMSIFSTNIYQVLISTNYLMTMGRYLPMLQSFDTQ